MAVLHVGAQPVGRTVCVLLQSRCSLVLTICGCEKGEAVAVYEVA
jgi:hypothetical protein